MALLDAAGLRTLARETLFAAGGRGFVRFAPMGGELLVTDAPRRCLDVKALADALSQAGFCCRQEEMLLMLSPMDALLLGWADVPMPKIEWESLHAPMCALAVRFLHAPHVPLTEQGRQLVLETLRLLWQDDAHVLAGLDSLRARAAVLLRLNTPGGIAQAGGLLAARFSLNDKK